MFTTFEKLKPQSRIWVYLSSRQLTPEEESAIRIRGMQFIEQWTAHNNNLLGSFEIVDNMFLLVAVDESVNDASGCSIDKSFAFIKQLELDFKLELLNRKIIAYQTEGHIATTEIANLSKLFKDGLIKEKDIVYNNLVHTKHQLADQWKIALKDSWLMQMV